MAGTDFGDKDWGKIIKLHLWNHIFDEIEAKGVSRNYNTKPNEKLHGPLKKHYLRRTNFKDVAPQVGLLFIDILKAYNFYRSCALSILAVWPESCEKICKITIA